MYAKSLWKSRLEIRRHPLVCALGHVAKPRDLCLPDGSATFFENGKKTASCGGANPRTTLWSTPIMQMSRLEESGARR